MPDALRPARVRAPASTSNLGAGFDCVGLALALYLDASFTPASGELDIERSGTLAGVSGEDVLVRTFRDALRRRGVEPEGIVRTTSEIPIARGLGSSATAVVAGMALASAALGEPIDLAATLAAATDLEGHPDNAAPTLLGGLVAVVPGDDGRPIPFRLALSGALAFAWAAPAVEVATATARAALPATVPHEVASRALARNAALIHGLANADPDLLRAGFADELHVPWRLPLIPGAVAAMRAALDAGAFAVTISGSGSGLLAVCPPGADAQVATAMADTFRRHADDDAARDAVIARALEPDPTGARVLPA